jgi:RHS repeat-associated protein
LGRLARAYKARTLGIAPVVEMDSSASVTATNTFGASGLISRCTGSANIFYSFDSEGNVSQRSDASGSVISNHLFSAHGSSLSGTLSDPFGYKAQFAYYTDSETGLQLLTHRYYDPSRGRFLTSDPISYKGGINLYSYVANTPITEVDTEGTQVRSDRNFRPGDVPRPSPPVRWQPPDNLYRKALEEIGDATGSHVNDDWTLTPGGLPYDDGLNNLRRKGFKQFFNPDPLHFGGSDWEGQIDGHWYHVIVGYPPSIAYPNFFTPAIFGCRPSFVDAHYEPDQPSSLAHLINYLMS